MRVLGPSRWVDLEPATAYAIARLRVDVFVVEQACPYPELDGRDLEPGAEHRWVAGDGDATGAQDDDAGGGTAGPVLAYLRVLAEDGGARRVGRVVTAPSARGRGLSAALLATVVTDHGAHDLVLDAQAHLEGWYARAGFAPDGPGFVEDGIPHVPMRRTGRPGPG